ncbi:MAG: hypothetical protein LBE78_08480 [Burkholderiaceae bacterium]|nr:hypothetical protein [Burkholderiaceae bacterium]
MPEVDEQTPAVSAPSPVKRSARILLIAAVLALALLATVAALALQIHFEAGDRERLHRALEHAHQVLAGVDDTAALAAMPTRMAAAFDHQRALAARVQNSLGQPLYEKRPETILPPALLTRPALALPAPLVTWRVGDVYWRGSALIMRMPLEGATPLTVAMALPVERDLNFLQRLRLVLIAYVLLASLGLTALAWKLVFGKA